MQGCFGGWILCSHPNATASTQRRAPAGGGPCQLGHSLSLTPGSKRSPGKSVRSQGLAHSTTSSTSSLFTASSLPTGSTPPSPPPPPLSLFPPPVFPSLHLFLPSTSLVFLISSAATGKMAYSSAVSFSANPAHQLLPETSTPWEPAPWRRCCPALAVTHQRSQGITRCD